MIGRALIANHGCTGCHATRAVASFAATTEPSRDGFGGLAQLAARPLSRPMLRIAWLLEPAAVHPAGAMPDQGLSEAEARHIATDLYTLR